MRKNKMLFLAVVVLLAILLSGCEKFFGSVDNSEHVHEFKYISVDDEVHCRRCECGEVDGYDSIHTLEWKNIDSFETAYRECVYCKYKEYQRDLYTRPLSIHSSTDGDPGEASIVYFVADIESGSFEYNEEFDIHLKVSLGTYYLEDGPFHIKLAESPYYEIVGDNEYKVTELVPQENRQYVMNFTFRVKATNPCSLIEAFDFKVKFNPTELFLNHASQYSSDGTWYYNSSEEFFFGFKQVMFINDSKGMILADRCDHRNINRFFYDSINREFLSGSIDDDVYIDRLVEYITGDRPDIWSDDIDAVAYRSKNIRAKMILGDEYKYLFDSSKGNFAERRPLIASIILDILLQKGYITDEEYQYEKTYIADRGYCDLNEYVLYENVPIADYVRENYYQFVCEDNDVIGKEMR